MYINHLLNADGDDFLKNLNDSEFPKRTVQELSQLVDDSSKAKKSMAHRRL